MNRCRIIVSKQQKTLSILKEDVLRRETKKSVGAEETLTSTMLIVLSCIACAGNMVTFGWFHKK